MTHNNVTKFNRMLRKYYGFKGAPIVVKATEIKDAGSIGIHLLNPTESELFEALETLQRDNFPRIVVHTVRTFGKAV